MLALLALPASRPPGRSATLSMDGYPDQALELVKGHVIALYECP